MSTALAESAAGGLNPLRQTKPRYGEKVIRGILFAAAAVSIFTTFGIIVSLLIPSLGERDLDELLADLVKENLLQEG